jgi:RNA polymerase primary sigma factor|tara:strand:+ start:4339 stop:5121 length:783 start_codon:yes stop_codon:yes gene_type:complete
MKKSIMTNSTDTISKYFKDVNKSSLLSLEDETKLAIRIQEGDKTAIDGLVEANLKFVISVAKGYQGLGLPLSDLISEGNLGLIKAANRFDHTRGFKFISYAVHWIKQTIMQSLNDNSRMIRLPANIITKISKSNRELLNNVGELEKEYPSCVSLNSPIGDFNGYELGDMVEDDSVDTLDVLTHETEKLKNIVHKTLNCLDVRERGIIECYFGLNTHCEPMTLEAIGDKYDLTKERIRQIKEKAIRRLRHNNVELFTLINS